MDGNLTTCDQSADEMVPSDLLEEINNLCVPATKKLGAAATLLAYRIASSGRRHSLANADLLESVSELAAQLGRYRISLSPKVRGRSIGKTRHVIDVITEQLDLVLHQAFPRHSLGWENLVLNKVFLPLESHLKSLDDCKIIADKVRNAQAELNENLFRPISNRALPEIIENLNSLNLLADILSAAYYIFSTYRIQWCRCCFRRAAQPSKYCTEHIPMSASVIDTAHRKGKRIRLAEVNKIAPKWAKLRSKWIAFEEADNAIYVDDEVVRFCRMTSHGNWISVAHQWDDLLDKFLLNVRSKFSKRASSFLSWDEFRKALLVGLNNKNETTHHPYLILMMLAEADDWFKAEADGWDRRNSNTENEIIELHEQNPERTMADIARFLGVSRQRVSVVLNGQKNN